MVDPERSGGSPCHQVLVHRALAHVDAAGNLPLADLLLEVQS